jgi:class 3 adenylate cyclase/predicted ATPase
VLRENPTCTGGAVPELTCASCGHHYREHAQFCEMCGAQLRGTPPNTHDAGGAERRQVTVLFSDLVGSTALGEHLDPEDLRDVIRIAQEVYATAIASHGGFIARYLGDGALAYFGYPMAHEDDARRAVRAGLAILDGMAAANAQLERERGLRLAVRIGVHTGLVVAGEIGQESLAIVGSAANVGARLQEVAEPDSVVMSAATHGLTAGYFECRSLGPIELKGVASPIEAFHVLGESDAQTRLEVGMRTGLTPLVGREEELRLLADRWRDAAAGAGQLVLVTGEAGIGKSRLAQELKERVGEEASVLECHGSPYHQHTALFPFTDLLQRIWRLRPRLTVEERRANLAQALAAHVGEPDEALALLAPVLGVPVSEEQTRRALSPQLARRKIHDALVEILLSMARLRPVLLVVEDLHWMDASSLEVLELLAAEINAATLLMVMLSRPEVQLSWAGQANAVLSLPRLSPDLTRQLAELVAGDRRLPPELVEELRHKTDGVPLYIEESTKMVLESGVLRRRANRYELAGPLRALAIPASLHASLVARLDRLGTAKEVLRLAATIGRVFPHDLLRAVWTGDDDTLHAGLQRLVEAEVIWQRGEPPQATYMFRHVLVQEAAYELLLHSRRRTYHRRIARVLAERFPETAAAQPELLGHHYAAAELVEDAVACYQRAGERALEGSAHAEAAAAFTRALELLGRLPDDAGRSRRELSLSTELGVALMASKGYAAPDVERVYARARELCRREEATGELFAALWGLGTFHQARAELTAASELAEQRLAIAERLDDIALQLQAHEAAGTVAFWQGEFAHARDHFDRCRALYDPRRGRELALRYGQDPGVVCRAYGALTLWFLGWPERALASAEDAVTLARTLEHPYSLALALDFAAALRQVRLEPAAAQTLAEPAIAIARRHLYPFWLGMGMIMRGWSLAAQGQSDEGLAQLLEGMSAYQGTGAQLGGRYCIALLAETYRLIGHHQSGLDALATALPAFAATEDHFWDAEVRRVEGELLLAASSANAERAESCFREALALSRSQNARMLELRATVSLTAVLARRGQRAERGAALAACYEGFTEGFDTADLCAARALLRELA